MRFRLAASVLAAGAVLVACGGDDDPGGPEAEGTADPAIVAQLRLEAACLDGLVDLLVPAFRAAEETGDDEAVRAALGDELPMDCAELDAEILAEVYRTATEEAIRQITSTESPSPSP